MQEQEIIKSVRVYEEKGVIHLDYRVQTTAKLPKGKSGNRFRFSTIKSYKNSYESNGETETYFCS